MKAIMAKLSFKEKFSYGLGDLASNCIWAVILSYLTFYYTDIFGISAAAVGTMFLIARAWDAVNDPLMGIVADRTCSKWGRYRPWLLWMAVPYGVIGILTFTTPDLPYNAKLVYAYVTYIALGMVYTAVNIPYGVLGAAMTQDPDERTSLNVYRMFFAMFGGLLINVLTLPMISALGNGNDRKGYQMTMAVFSILAVLFFIIAFRGTEERVKVEKDRISVRESLSSLKGNLPWLLLFIQGFIGFVIYTIKGGTGLYYFTYNVGRQELFPLFMMATMLPMLLGVVLSGPASFRLGKRNTVILANAIALPMYVMFYFASPENIPFIFAVNIVASTSLGMTMPLGFSMLADTVEYSHWKTGIRAPGVILSAGGFAGKMGTGIGGALLGWILAFVGYNPNGAQSEAALEGIRFLACLVPAIGSMIVIVIMLFYKLDRKTYMNILSDLEKGTTARSAMENA